MKTIRQFTRDHAERVIGTPSVPIVGYHKLDITEATEKSIDSFRRIRETPEGVLHRAVDALENNKKHKMRQRIHYAEPAAVLAASITGSLFLAHRDSKPAAHKTVPAVVHHTSLKSDKRN